MFKHIVKIINTLLVWSVSAGLLQAAVVTPDVKEKIKTMLAKPLNTTDLSTIDIHDSPIPGLYEVIAPPQVIYVSKDLAYLVYADITQVADTVNLTDLSRAAARKRVLDAMGRKSMIIYSPKKDTRYSVTVMTDLDCGYCQKLHSEISQYNDLGIEIRYIAFPRTGILTPSYYKAVNVWCAKDRKKAYDEVSAGKAIADGKCENPVADQFKFGQQIGVQGTPTLILSDGSVLVGYYPPEKLLAELQSHRNIAKAR
ncbi:MAG: thioredoxin fold domain-containing protein [Gammaproteobacteria bacterium]|nr:thioredoxin fold domain-containing protein [Gammaproteobacteria bacterium]